MNVYPSFLQYYREHRAGIDAVLLDIDGTLSVFGQPQPGAKELLDELIRDGIPFLLLTNDSCKSCKQKAEQICRTGLPVTGHDLFSAGDALKTWAGEHAHAGTFFQCGELGDPNYAEAAGIAVTQDLNAVETCSGIIFGEGDFDWKSNWNAAFNFLLNHPEAPCIVANPDSYWLARGRTMGIGAGGIARFIVGLVKEAGFDVNVTYLGKPYPLIYRAVGNLLPKRFPQIRQVIPERIVMVGDSLKSDIAGANSAGYRSCLVLCGITNAELAESAPPEAAPDVICQRI